ncbi:MAG: hypothetical protein ACI8V2_000606 [Candidatus Latescibacterota bacterium]|jgi:hypothetical protein
MNQHGREEAVEVIQLAYADYLQHFAHLKDLLTIALRGDLGT